MSLKIKTTTEIAKKLKDAKTFDARLFQPLHSQADKREMQKLLNHLQKGNRASFSLIWDAKPTQRVLQSFLRFLLIVVNKCD